MVRYWVVSAAFITLSLSLCAISIAQAQSASGQSQDKKNTSCKLVRNPSGDSKKYGLAYIVEDGGGGCKKAGGRCDQKLPTCVLQKAKPEDQNKETESPPDALDNTNKEPSLLDQLEKMGQDLLGANKSDQLRDAEAAFNRSGAFMMSKSESWSASSPLEHIGGIGSDYVAGQNANSEINNIANGLNEQQYIQEGVFGNPAGKASPWDEAGFLNNQQPQTAPDPSGLANPLNYVASNPDTFAIEEQQQLENTLAPDGNTYVDRPQYASQAAVDAHNWAVGWLNYFALPQLRLNLWR